MSDLFNDVAELSAIQAGLDLDKIKKEKELKEIVTATSHRYLDKKAIMPNNRGKTL